MKGNASSGDVCPLGLRGIVSAINTPFTNDDRVDPNGVKRLVDYLATAGCAGILVPAVAGEVGSLTIAERRIIVDTVLYHVAGRMDVVVGLSGLNAPDRLRLAREVTRDGAAGVLYNPPETERGADLEAALAGIAEADPGFIMLQDLDWHGGGIGLSEIVSLFERIPAFKALKVEVVPAGPKFGQVLEATGGRLHVSGGWSAGQMIEALSYGVHAFMPCGMEAVYCHIFRLFASGDRNAARSAFERLLPVIAFANQHISVGIRFKKRFRVAQGVFDTDHCRPPVPQFDRVQMAEADLLIDRALGLEREIEACSKQQ